MPASNRELAATFAELARLTKLEDENPQSFRARAYETAARSLDGLAPPAYDLSDKDLEALPGIGKSSVRKIREYLDTGSMQKLEDLREVFPLEYVAMTRIPGLGPKTASRLRSELGIHSIDDLEKAIATQSIRELPGMGAKTEEKIADAIERLGLTGKERRTPIINAMGIARRVLEDLRELPGIEQVRYAGSLRRQRETIADVDILVGAADPEPVMRHVVERSDVAEVLVSGDTKTSVVTKQGMQIDVRVVDPGVFGAALLYFTGSKAHNIRLRQLAIARGWSLSEYGLVDDDTTVAAEDETTIYEALDLPYIPARMREDTGEIEAARDGELPDVPLDGVLRGDLHVHTDMSGDGRASLDEMVAAAASRGLEYLAITDHAENLTINGVGRDAMLAQRTELAAVQERYGVRLLHGAELNIGPGGDLDYDAEFRSTYEFCVASVHSHFDLDATTQTQRVVAAAHDPSVRAIGHLTGRRVGRRPGIKLDYEKVLSALRDTGTALEINSNLDRLDAAADVIHAAALMEVEMVISSDAHEPGEFDNLRWGIRQAQRGWSPRHLIANALPLHEFENWLTIRSS